MHALGIDQRSALIGMLSVLPGSENPVFDGVKPEIEKRARIGARPDVHPETDAARGE